MAARARVIFILLALSVLSALITGRDLFFNLTYMWGGLILISFIWSRLALRGIEVERIPWTNRAQVGQYFIERFQLSNRSRFPKLWVETRDLSDLLGYRVTTVSVWLGFRGQTEVGAHRSVTVTTGLPAHQVREWTIRTFCTQRGRFQLGPMTVGSSDPFGLFPVRKQIPSWQHIVVLPVTAPIRAFPLPSGRLPGGDALRQRTHQITPNASTVRDYVPGDSLSRIHWKSTARRRQLMVKEFELDPLAEIWIILDADKGVLFQRPPLADEQVVGVGETFKLPPSTFEYSVAVAASLAMHFLERDRSTGLVSYGQTRHVSQPETGNAQQFRLLESLAVVEAEGVHPLEDILKIESPRIPQGATVILISSSGSEQMLTGVRQLMHAGRLPILVMVDPASFGATWEISGLAESARKIGASVRVVRYGDSLGDSLGDPHRLAKSIRAA
jgi:uncharacterized protein (DUF58 family)